MSEDYGIELPDSWEPMTEELPSGGDTYNFIAGFTNPTQRIKIMVWKISEHVGADKREDINFSINSLRETQAMYNMESYIVEVTVSDSLEKVIGAEDLDNVDEVVENLIDEMEDG